MTARVADVKLRSSRRTFVFQLLTVVSLAKAAAAEQDSRVYVAGHVRTPGSYPIPKSGKLSVRDAVKLAGDPTERGDLDSITITRRVNGKPVDIPAKAADLVQPNDVVQVGRKPSDDGR